MSVYNRRGARGAIWYVRFQWHGREVRRATRASSRREAEAIERRIRDELVEAERRAQLGLPARHKFDDALLKWLEGEAKALKSYKQTLNHCRTIRDYTRDRWLEDGPQIAADVKAAQIAAGLKPATVNQRLAIVRRVLNLAHQWGWLDEPLGRRVRLLPPRNARHLYLKPAQVEALAQACGRAGDIVRVLAYTGLRISELYRVQTGDIDNGWIRINADTKNDRARAIPIPDPIRGIVIVPTLTRHQLRRLFEDGRAKVGMGHIHLHDLRHTYASLLIQAGVPMAVVRDLLGHSNLTVTSRYAHLGAEDLMAAVARLKR